MTTASPATDPRGGQLPPALALSARPRDRPAPPRAVGDLGHRTGRRAVLGVALVAPEVAATSLPGQFVMISLARPRSRCHAAAAHRGVRLDRPPAPSTCASGSSVRAPSGSPRSSPVSSRRSWARSAAVPRAAGHPARAARRPGHRGVLAHRAGARRAGPRGGGDRGGERTARRGARGGRTDCAPARREVVERHRRRGDERPVHAGRAARAPPRRRRRRPGGDVRFRAAAAIARSWRPVGERPSSGRSKSTWRVASATATGAPCPAAPPDARACWCAPRARCSRSSPPPGCEPW